MHQRLCLAQKGPDTVRRLWTGKSTRFLRSNKLKLSNGMKGSQLELSQWLIPCCAKKAMPPTIGCWGQMHESEHLSLRATKPKLNNIIKWGFAFICTMANAAQRKPQMCCNMSVKPPNSAECWLHSLMNVEAVCQPSVHAQSFSPADWLLCLKG